MAVTRLIFCKFPADQTDQAIENWKEHCAPLMIQQDGCQSEQLLRSTDNPGEFISCSEWEDEAAIRKYLDSDAHQEIKKHNRNIQGAEVTIKLYETIS